MTVETVADPLRRSDDLPAGTPASLRRLQREMLLRTSAATTHSDLLRSLLSLLREYLDPLAVFYFSRNEQNELVESDRLAPEQADERSRRFARQLAAACTSACRMGELEVRQQVAPPRTILAAPIALYGHDPEALGMVVQSDLPTEQVIMLVQMATSHVVLWHILAATRGNQADAYQMAALIELVEQVLVAPSLRHACYSLTGELQSFLHCQRVALGLRTAGKGRCRLAAISGVAQFDKHSSSTQAIEAAMDEAVLRQEVTHWPVTDDQQRHAALAHKNLCTLEEAQAVVSIPLRDAQEQTIGVLLLFNDKQAPLTEAGLFLRAAESSFATVLSTAQQLEGGRLTRAWRAMGRTWQSSQGKLAAAAAVVILAALLIPLPHKIHCDCAIEPVTRRFVAAPFESSLEKSLVKPGDLVQKGELLARLDGREVRWKRAGVAADRQQALKRRDVAQATRNYAEGQIAKLEIQRLDLELQLLDHRAHNLEIRSPLHGIVASGDLERAQGAPLAIGQTLFEIAPLESMIVEVAVPDDEIAYVREGQSIDIRLDAYPARDWQVVAQKIQPRSEIRDQQNVFIAEARLDNSTGELRPGMKGRAKVIAPSRPLGWILFHQPWEYVVKKLSW